METSDFLRLYQHFTTKLSKVSTTFHRYLYDQIDWNNRLIGIKGAGGVGKTTLVLQHIKEQCKDIRQVLYVSLDNLWFETHDLMDLVDYHYTHGGTVLVLDEVHRLRHWATYIKNIYDDYPNLQVIYTGSSMLSIAKYEVDLSRRQRVYTLEVMSFREFLQFEGFPVHDAISWNDLLQQHTTIAMHITEITGHILPLFEKYVRYGCYPFYKEAGDGFSERLQSTIFKVLENDLPQVEDVEPVTIRKTLRMLLILAERVPLMPKMAELYRELETTRDQGLKMLNWLEKSGLIHLVNTETTHLNSLSKPDKIYLNNPNLMHCLSSHINIGTLRETFFYSQVHAMQEVLLPKQGDFLIQRQQVFEVGGKSKTFDQIKDTPNSFLAVDDIETGAFNRLPLWMFGLLY